MQSSTRKSFHIAAAGVLCLGLSGCVAGDGSKQQAGTVIGAVVGGVIGSQFGGSTGARIAAGVAGTLIGGFIGSAIGAQLDEADRQALAEMTYYTASTGAPRRYYTPRTGGRVATRPGRTTRVAATPTQVASICRTVEQEVVLADGTKKQENIESCRGSDGNWKVT